MSRTQSYLWRTSLLESHGGGRACTRRAKRLVLLKRHEADHLFIEARRAELLETYLVLSVAELVGPVREFLRASARDGWRELSSETLPGLPTAWTAFGSVQLERVADVAVEDLAPLQPIARTHVALGGGLPLPGMNTWHRDKPPELRVVVDERGVSDTVDVRAIPTRYLDGAKEADVPIAELEGAGVVDLSAVSELREGDFRIVIASRAKSRTLATAVLRLRSGSWPRRLDDGEDALIGHALLHGGRLAAHPGPVPQDLHATFLLGALVKNPPPPTQEERAARAPLPDRPGVLVEPSEEDSWDPAETGVEGTTAGSTRLFHARPPRMALRVAARKGTRVQRLPRLRAGKVVGSTQA